MCWIVSVFFVVGLLLYSQWSTPKKTLHLRFYLEQFEDALQTVFIRYLFFFTLSLYFCGVMVTTNLQLALVDLLVGVFICEYSPLVNRTVAYSSHVTDFPQKFIATILRFPDQMANLSTPMEIQRLALQLPRILPMVLIHYISQFLNSYSLTRIEVLFPWKAKYAHRGLFSAVGKEEKFIGIYIPRSKYKKFIKWTQTEKITLEECSCWKYFTGVSSHICGICTHYNVYS